MDRARAPGVDLVPSLRSSAPKDSNNRQSKAYRSGGDSSGK